MLNKKDTIFLFHLHPLIDDGIGTKEPQEESLRLLYKKDNDTFPKDLQKYCLLNDSKNFKVSLINNDLTYDVDVACKFIIYFAFLLLASYD